MPRSLTVQLAKAADVLEGNRRMAQVFISRIHRLRFGEVEDRPEQHRCVPVRKHESVAVWPDWILRIEVYGPVPDCVNQRRQRHRRAGMAGFGGLDRIDGKCADRVDGEFREFVVGHKCSNGYFFFASTKATLLSRRRW